MDILRMVPGVGAALDEYEAMLDQQCPVDEEDNETCCWHVYLGPRCQMAKCCHCGVMRPSIGVHKYRDDKEHGPLRVQEGDIGVRRVQT